MPGRPDTNTDVVCETNDVRTKVFTTERCGRPIGPIEIFRNDVKACFPATIEGYKVPLVGKVVKEDLQIDVETQKCDQDIFPKSVTITGKNFKKFIHFKLDVVENDADPHCNTRVKQTPGFSAQSVKSEEMIQPSRDRQDDRPNYRSDSQDPESTRKTRKPIPPPLERPSQQREPRRGLQEEKLFEQQKIHDDSVKRLRKARSEQLIDEILADERAKPQENIRLKLSRKDPVDKFGAKQFKFDRYHDALLRTSNVEGDVILKKTDDAQKPTPIASSKDTLRESVKTPIVPSAPVPTSSMPSVPSKPSKEPEAEIVVPVGKIGKNNKRGLLCRCIEQRGDESDEDAVRRLGKLLVDGEYDDDRDDDAYHGENDDLRKEPTPVRKPVPAGASPSILTSAIRSFSKAQPIIKTPPPVVRPVTKSASPKSSEVNEPRVYVKRVGNVKYDDF
ncbi:hypothetical protein YASMINEVIRUS_1027 [Yasminevirus sp. GU-2018]|uniref:Uncharacterized protein n=1 Tax=Yasminevirus sp. GU-2018 TaxID=2420051 RepID=A0A5K0UAR2_9VIRU|nr:hypothetical protein YASMINEVIRUS_1027 [Yasminevirus sp. GU-2018]